jgi:hypothetical protein
VGLAKDVTGRESGRCDKGERKTEGRTRISAVSPLMGEAHVRNRCILYMSPSNASRRTSDGFCVQEGLAWNVERRKE